MRTAGFACAGFMSSRYRLAAVRNTVPAPPWPPGFARIPDEDWARRPIERLAEHYDTVERHGWYDNLDPTVDQMERLVQDGDVWVDYSGGTGILMDRLLARLPSRAFGIVNVDSSPKFLRLSLEKFQNEPRAAFRLIHYLPAERRLQLLDEVFQGPLRDRGVDGIVSTNAVHLYYDLPDTLASWRRSLRPGGHVLVQSGNIASDDGSDEGWIIDDTVHAVARAARDIVTEDDRFAHLRPLLDDPERLARYDALRDKYFVPVRPLSFYLDALRSAELNVASVDRRTIRANVDEWFEFLAVYHEGVLGWIGGAEKLEGRPPTDRDVDDRLAIMRRAMARIFDDKDHFDAVWTYITAHRDRP